ncbi:MAG: sigma 54-interacting transcriptional regulator [Pseudomonadota bacterium]
MDDHIKQLVSAANLPLDILITLLDKINIGAFAVDLNRRLTAINSSARAMLGLGEADLLGLECREVFRGVPCRSSCPFQGNWTPVKEGDVEVLDACNQTHLVTRLSAPIFNGDKNPIGGVAVLHDHAPFSGLLARLNYEEKNLKTIFDRLDLALFTVTRGGHIAFFNQAAETALSFSRDDVLGKPACFLMGAEDHDGPAMLRAVIRDGRPRSSGSVFINTGAGDQREFKVDFMALTNEQGRVVGGLAALHDLTLVRRLDQMMKGDFVFFDMVGRSPAMRKVFEMVRIAANSDSTVLIEGATGTGKDLLARAIHQAGERRNKPLVKVNCAALPDNLLESEMFGFSRGAFTGADRDKPGRFLEADGGAILLDEIGDLPLSLQAKLLRVLEEKEFYPLGGRRTVKVNVRIIAATNRGLENLIRQRQFREDLFYRLNVFRIELPPLRERQPDLPLLIRSKVRRFCAEGNKRIPDISKKAMDALLAHDYPGNIRELENILEYAILTCRDGIIQPEHLQPYLQTRLGPPPGPSNRAPSRPLGTGADRERDKILAMLEKYNWRRRKTAQSLHMDRTTLWRKMRKYGLEPPLSTEPAT